jgi:hypothetical protein
MAAPFFPAGEPEQKAIAACLGRLGLLNGRSSNLTSSLRFDHAAPTQRMYGSPAPAKPAAWVEK